MQCAHPSMYMNLGLIWALYVISKMYTNAYKSIKHKFRYSIVSNHIFINIIQYRVKQNIIDALYGFGSIFHVFVA